MKTPEEKYVSYKLTVEILHPPTDEEIEEKAVNDAMFYDFNEVARYIHAAKWMRYQIFGEEEL